MVNNNYKLNENEKDVYYKPLLMEHGLLLEIVAQSDKDLTKEFSKDIGEEKDAIKEKEKEFDTPPLGV